MIELTYRLEEINIGLQFLVNGFQQGGCLRRCVAPVANIAPNDITILMLDKSLVILAIGARAGEGQLFSLTMAFECAVDEGAIIITVNA